MASIEETVGTNWLPKVGIVLTVLAIARFGIYEFGQIGPFGKVVLSSVLGAVLLIAGILFEMRERYRILGRTGIGGGWAVLFFTSYAVNHVTAMRVLESATADSVLMLIVAGVMTVHTLRYNSQVVTAIAFLLGYSTVALSQDNVYSLTAGVILALGLVTIVLRRGWYELEFFGILSSYLNHLYWLYRLLGPDGAQGRAFPEYHASTALLFFYWATFRVSYVIRKIQSPAAEHISTASALANTVLLLLAMKFQSVRPELAYIALFAIGAVEFVCGQLPQIRRRREAFIVLTVLGASLMVGAVPSHYSGNNVVILWMVGAESLLVAGCAVNEVVFRRLGLLAGFLAGGHLVAIEFARLLETRRTTEAMVLASGVVFAVSATVFYANALWIGRKWHQFFATDPDEKLMIGHSYLGGFSAVAAAWALCSADWTAVALVSIMLAVVILDRRLGDWHLRMQNGVMGLLTLVRVVVVNLHADSPSHQHITVRIMTLPVIATVFYVAAWLVQPRDVAGSQVSRHSFAAAGTAVVAALIYFEVPTLWQPAAGALFAMVLAEAAIRLRYRGLSWHVHAVTALAVVASWNGAQTDSTRWHGIPLYAIAALPVVAGAYWLAKRIGVADPDRASTGAIAYSWAASAVGGWILYEGLQAPWVAVGWIVFACLLVVAGRRLPFKHLGWQGSALAFGAFGLTFLNNFPLQTQFTSGISVRMVTVALVAAGLYGISRRASAPESEHSQVSALLHSCAATALLATLAWYEAPTGWLAAVWAIFALALALVDWRFNLEELGWQAHALAALALLRSVSVNLYLIEKWHGVSVRLLSLAIVAVVLYTLCRIVRMPEGWRARGLNHVYSWSASTLVSLLFWYELQPLSIAIAWAVFGLVLFEYGLLRGVQQFRYQAYVAFCAAFVRIFFANLAADSPGMFWGPRVYTTLPLALIFLFAYTQISTTDNVTAADRSVWVDVLLSCLGTGTLVALAYFQLAPDWVVTAWALTVFLLLGVATLTGRRIFLNQGLVLALAVMGRGLVHNLFGASYFTGGDWSGRYLVLASSVAILYACLPFAFRLREREGKATRMSWRAIASAVSRRPEQVVFFVATVLLTVMLALKMRAGMVTVSWGIEGVLVVILALFVGERSFRLTGLVLLLACVAKIIARDAWQLSLRDRYLTFMVLGIALLLVSFLYTKYRETIHQFL